ncbi:hypothetical protein [Sphingomonas sp. 22176]|uniref:hypothetical protein n=1 Tax=Sphingomonas sp. 22176 TaxID=3453884 RepID=UPI003F845ACC
MIERFLPGLDALLAEPLDTHSVSVAFPGDMDPHEREGRYGVFLDAELRIAGLGTCGGGTLIETLDDAGQWRPACAILDVDLTDLDLGRAFCRDELASLGCPEGTLIQYDDQEDRWDGETWQLNQPRSFDEDMLPYRDN